LKILETYIRKYICKNFCVDCNRVIETKKCHIELLKKMFEEFENNLKREHVDEKY